ncbi:MAG TPA: hypothetical protein VEH84_14800 [Alphaproteobacteria bacterium]|nr:hypothetical protein [Alphaproteobacteria bacterium]
MADFPYSIPPSEPSLTVELYLAKKSYLQGVLYDTLTAGFDPERVKAHLRGPRRAEIAALLARHQIGPPDDATIDGFRDVFWGYSVYEVDGVFRRGAGGFDEERAQIVRILFKPDYGEILGPAAGGPAGARYRALAMDWLTLARDDPAPSDGLDAAVLRSLAGWYRCCMLFTFGYVIFHLCDAVLARHRERPDDVPVEEEIWVSTASQLVSRAVLRAGPADGVTTGAGGAIAEPAAAEGPMGAQAKERADAAADRGFGPEERNPEAYTVEERLAAIDRIRSMTPHPLDTDSADLIREDRDNGWR